MHCLGNPQKHSASSVNQESLAAAQIGGLQENVNAITVSDKTAYQFFYGVGLTLETFQRHSLSQPSSPRGLSNFTK